MEKEESEEEGKEEVDEEEPSEANELAARRAINRECRAAPPELQGAVRFASADDATERASCSQGEQRQQRVLAGRRELDMLTSGGDTN